MSRNLSVAVLALLGSVVASCGDDSSGSKSCEAPLVACGGDCVDLQADAAHCGDCDRACEAGRSCVDGRCTAAESCPAGTERCGDGCVDTDTDRDHCGACGNACPVGVACEAGSCGCPAGEERCGEACVDLDTDPDHCGGCETACGDGMLCADGDCACPSDREECEPGLCADLQSDQAHCGSCGNACTGGTICVAGGCVCPDGWLDCDGTCADPKTDAAHCGACGLACADGLVCRTGACAAAPCGNGFGLPAPSRVDAGAVYGGIAVGDLDGDGDPDLLTADAGEPYAVRWLENLGGTFAPPVTIAAAPAPLVDLLIADLDGEGPPDIAGVFNQSSPKIHLVLRGATGEARVVAVSWPYVRPHLPKDPRVADLDGDGDLDLVLSDGNYRTIHVAKNLGGGNFEAIPDPVPLPPEARPDGLAIGDMDGDGDDDLVIAEGHELYTVKTVGPFEFVPGEVYVNGSQHGELALGDFDGDGDLDVVLDEGHMARNDGTGRFSDYGALEPRQTLAWRMATGDVDGDGDVDFVGFRSGDFDVMWNEGDHFVGYSGAAGFGVTLPFLADVDGDGALDFVVGNLGSRWIDVLPNPGDGRFPAPVRIGPILSTSPALAVGEIDTTPGPDVLVVPGGETRMYLLHPGVSDSGLAFAPEVYTGAALVELDGDPQAEIATVWQELGVIQFLNGWPPRAGRVVEIEPGLTSLVGVDVDGDGATDLVTLEAGTAPGLRVLLADDFTPSPLLPLVGGSTPREALPVDLDGDGDRDLLVAGDQGLHLVVNDGGTLVDSKQYGIVPKAIAAGDLDGDGRVDLAAADADEDRIVVLFQRDEGFESGPVIDLAAAELAIADLDADGRDDLLVLTGNVMDLLVFRGGPGFPGPALGWPALFYGNAALIAEDLDGDLRPDVVAVDREYGIFYPSGCLP